MEKKRWVFIFSALCLSLAFSVSSVEAQGAENNAKKCSDGKDNDRDGFTDCADQSCIDAGFCNSTTTTLKVHLDGPFVFDAPGGVLEVFLNPNGNTALSDDAVMMTRPQPSDAAAGEVLSCDFVDDGGGLAETWHDVFCTCGALLSTSPPDFSVGADSWRININTVEVQDVHVLFSDIPFDLPETDPPADINMQLIGDLDDVTSFPPPPNLSIEIDLQRFAIWGSTRRGFHPRSGCQGRGGAGLEVMPLPGTSTLTICGENVNPCPPSP